jgi:hypothetical protein
MRFCGENAFWMVFILNNLFVIYRVNPNLGEM